MFTPAYRSGERILRLYRSLTAQTYDNWEWVVYDDSPDDATFELLRDIRRTDPRVVLFRSDEPCGVIGEVKRRCCGLARGEILAEADHDDELTDHCLADVVAGFNAFPDAGFVYTDCAEVFEDGRNAYYDQGYAFGFGSYRNEFYRGREYLVTNYPSINAKTVRHIVGMPNHIRAWRRAAYQAAGGHASAVHVADDFELCIRTFLTTRMVHVRRFGYIHTSAPRMKIPSACVTRKSSVWSPILPSVTRTKYTSASSTSALTISFALTAGSTGPLPIRTRRPLRTMYCGEYGCELPDG